MTSNINGLSLLQFGNCSTVNTATNAISLTPSAYPLMPVISLLRANNLTEAKTYLQLKSFDVIFLTLDFADEQYQSALDLVKANAAHCAIVVLTQPQFEQQAMALLNQGIFDYLTLDEINGKSVSRMLRHAQEYLRHKETILSSSTIDSVTGLANRAGFMEFIQRQLAEADRLQFHLSLFYVDCDNFKVINDTLGHQKGDDFLAHVAQHLKGCVRNNDFVARLSADEFVVVIKSKDNRIIPSAVVAENILQAIRRGVQLTNGEFVESHCSIGITHYNGEGPAPNADKFLLEAASALKQSKLKGGDCTCFFDNALGHKAERRTLLLRNIRQAFKRGEFYLNYQPIIDATTDRVRGFEALLRWNRESKERISPEEFVPLLEETGMIHLIGNWVILQACKDFSNFINAGYISDRGWISVNISPLQLQDPNFVQRLQKNLNEVDIPPRQLHLEITESSLMEKSEFTFQTLASIKALGCGLSLDDFGVGYSSMNHLKVLPIDTLKIDQSFIRNFHNDESDQAMIRAIVSLAHNLGKTVVAEGVETEAVAAFLKQRRCEFLQGYFYSKPLSMLDAMEFTRVTNKIQHDVLLDIPPMSN